MASSSSSFSSSDSFKYDAFLNFRGEDTRFNFISHLYASLARRGIKTFIDEELSVGDEISSSLLDAIRSSSISIVVFSEYYADSGWCLEELAEIVECNKRRGQAILPVFYHVDPSDVRKQRGSYEQAFMKHEVFMENDVKKWRGALTHVANLSGFVIDGHRSEASVIEEIIKSVLKSLKFKLSNDLLDDCVGISLCIARVKSLLCIGIPDIRVIGIWGMGGIGKTTIAQVVFQQIADRFEGHCFQRNVKKVQTSLLVKVVSDILEEDPNTMENNLPLHRLGRKRSLIVLDDVENESGQVQLLVKHLGPGSRIILTSRDTQVLKNCGAKLYEHEKLGYCEAMQLFSVHAFKENQPPRDYMQLSNQFVHYADGNPLSLKVLGNYLFDRTQQQWKYSLEKLQKIQNPEIYELLKLSYYELDDDVQSIFLDIACCFLGWDIDRAKAIMTARGYHTEIGIRILVDKCLVIVSENRLLMHELIQKMAHHMVRQESREDPSRCSRLCNPQEISNLFHTNTGTDAIQSISLDLSQISKLSLSCGAFENIVNLKYLQLYKSRYNGSAIPNYEDYKGEHMVHLHPGLGFLPNGLRSLQWLEFPFKHLPSNYSPKLLVDLDLQYSNIEYLWNDNQDLPNLKHIDLSCSQNLVAVPNLSQARNLEILNLNRCCSLAKFPVIPWKIKKLCLSHTAIEEVPSTIASCNELVLLRLNNCTRLKNLPRSMCGLTSLVELNLFGCSSVTEFPEISGEVKYLFLGETAIEEVPSSVGHLIKLNQLSLTNCTRLKRVAPEIFKLKFLIMLSLSGCTELNDLPQVLENEGSLIMLGLDRTAIGELPSSIELLSKLTYLTMAWCENLKSLPNRFCNLRSLSSLDLSGLSGVGKMLENLELSSSSGFCSLKELYLCECDLLSLPNTLGCLLSLQRLNLKKNNFESLSLKPFSSLKDLDISCCTRLKFLLEFPSPLRLINLQANQCISLETLPTTNEVFTGNRTSHQSFIYSNCLKLNENARMSILADAQQRIRALATKAWQTSSIEGYLEKGNQQAFISFCFPGSEIPEWFTCRNEGSSVKIDLPPQWCRNDFLGFVLCIVAAFDNNSCSNFSLKCECKCINHEGEWHGMFSLLEPLATGLVMSDHVFLVHAQRYDRDWRFSQYSPYEKAIFQFSALDNAMRLSANFNVKRCGVHLLYSEEEITKHVEQEKLNLDRSSGDDCMEEDVLGNKQIDSKDSSEEAMDRTDNSEVPVVKEESPVVFVGDGFSADKKDVQVENKSCPVVPAEKRKIIELVGSGEPLKRQHRWNAESPKIPEQQSSNLTAASTPRDTSWPTTLKRSFSRSDSGVSEDAAKERVVPPSPKPPTNSLRIDHFVLPFTLKAVQELLGKTGTFSNFWMDHIETHCYVTYSSVEEAIETRNALYNIQWPPNNGGRPLVAEFVDPQEVKMKLEAPKTPVTPVSTGPTAPPAPPAAQPQPSPRQLVSRQQLPPPPNLPPPPPITNQAPARERFTLPPPPPQPEKVDPPIVTLDDLFRKTKATPRIYYLPLSEKQVAAKLQSRNRNTKQ